MAYTALYREWRPKIFDDVVGQEHITTTLRNQILKERTAHAYLFCGTRGTGKTSTAKIMAKALNCLDLQEGEPCNQCDMCKKIGSGLSIDVTELDAASNNGIDKIRDIIDDVQYPPQEAKFKVYIMDEVHMLSQGAVNAFLKTLEEPPNRVVFILATTDPQKLPITILSRCQRFDFKRIKTEDVSTRLRKIVDGLGVFADDNSLDLVSRMSDGAMRDALSILDQAIAMGGGKIEYNNVIEMLGLVTSEHLLNLTECALSRDTEKAMRIIDDIVFAGKDVQTFIKDLTTHMRNLLMVKVSNNPQEVLDMSLENIELLKKQSDKLGVEEIMRFIRILQEAEEQSKWSKQGRIYLELALIKMCRIEFDNSPEVILARINKLESALRSGKIAVSVDESEGPRGNEQRKSLPQEKPKPNVVKKQEDQEEIEENFNESSELNISKVEKAWRDILETFKSRRQMVIYASLITGRLYSCRNGVIEIRYEEKFSFNKQRLEKEDYRKLIDGVFSEVLREKVKVKYTIEKEEKEVSESKEDKLRAAFGEDMVEIIDS
ncbi:DNA polymerase III subunit gamma/tau [Clostridium sp.]|uniref:DNA polymerase III subunit gamma/tau n=1 Tax=Clostridium sp. TaxID=1506 RepID=UPI0034647F1B